MKHFSDLPVLIWNKNMDPFDLGGVAHRIITHDQQRTPGAEQNIHPGYVTSRIRHRHDVDPLWKALAYGCQI